MMKLETGLVNLCLTIFYLLLIAVLVSGCVKTVTETKVQYISPTIPDSLLEPCESVSINQISTNGDLLISYISLQTSYAMCSAKVNSIVNILNSYNEIYSIDLQESLDTDITK